MLLHDQQLSIHIPSMIQSDLLRVKSQDMRSLYLIYISNIFKA